MLKVREELAQGLVETESCARPAYVSSPVLVFWQDQTQEATQTFLGKDKPLKP